MPTYGIPVMFDVTVDGDRGDAARLLSDTLVALRAADGQDVESWWFIEGQDKHADGNDESAGTIVWDELPVVGTYPLFQVTLQGGAMFNVAAFDSGEAKRLVIDRLVRDGYNLQLASCTRNGTWEAVYGTVLWTHGEG